MAKDKALDTRLLFNTRTARRQHANIFISRKTRAPVKLNFSVDDIE